jgi:hypothetical protein
MVRRTREVAEIAWRVEELLLLEEMAEDGVRVEIDELSLRQNVRIIWPEGHKRSRWMTGCRSVRPEDDR